MDFLREGLGLYLYYNEMESSQQRQSQTELANTKNQLIQTLHPYSLLIFEWEIPPLPSYPHTDVEKEKRQKLQSSSKNRLLEDNNKITLTQTKTEIQTYMPQAQSTLGVTQIQPKKSPHQQWHISTSMSKNIP